MIRQCKRHGETSFATRTDGRYRCRKCASEAVTRRRRKVSAILVDEAGGKCVLCGYSRSYAALVFHHRIPAEKEFGIASKGATIALDRLRVEAAKCDLLCANCHAEVEYPEKMI